MLLNTKEALRRASVLSSVGDTDGIYDGTREGKLEIEGKEVGFNDGIMVGSFEIDGKSEGTLEIVGKRDMEGF